MTFTCACGAPAMAIKPGQNGETVTLRGTEIVMRRPVPDEAWCLAHWTARFAQNGHGGGS